jgi:hypothetical protein
VHHWREKYRDAIGDVGVTLLMGCATADVDFVECLQQAYEEIKDRKGYLRADGVFVKESWCFSATSQRKPWKTDLLNLVIAGYGIRPLEKGVIRWWQ